MGTPDEHGDVEARLMFTVRADTLIIPERQMTANWTEFRIVLVEFEWRRFSEWFRCETRKATEGSTLSPNGRRAKLDCLIEVAKFAKYRAEDLHVSGMEPERDADGNFLEFCEAWNLVLVPWEPNMKVEMWAYGS
jgi:hypothetical protein